MCEAIYSCAVYTDKTNNESYSRFRAMQAFSFVLDTYTRLVCYHRETSIFELCCFRLVFWETHAVLQCMFASDSHNFFSHVRI